MSEYLGHASTSVTADVYQHVTEELQRLAADALGGLFEDDEDSEDHEHEEHVEHEEE